MGRQSGDPLELTDQPLDVLACGAADRRAELGVDAAGARFVDADGPWVNAVPVVGAVVEVKPVAVELEGLDGDQDLGPLDWLAG